MVYRGTDTNIYELALDGHWVGNDLLTVSDYYGRPPASSGDPTAWVSSWDTETIAMVVYAAFPDIYVLFGPNGWEWSNISTNDGTNDPAVQIWGNRPFGYRTNDGVDRVVYRGTFNNIYELSNQQGLWECHTLSTNTKGAPPAPPTGGDPFAYVTNDGIPRVIYRGADGHIYELHPDPYWIWADLSHFSGGAPQAWSDPFAYVTNDGIARVLYIGGTDTESGVIELRLEGGWKWGNLSTDNKNAPPAPPPAWSLTPFGYVAPDGIPRVVYTGNDGHIYELHLGSVWIWHDLSHDSGAPQAASAPFGYSIFDGIPRVVYRGVDGHVYELSLW